MKWISKVIQFQDSSLTFSPLKKKQSGYEFKLLQLVFCFCMESKWLSQKDYHSDVCNRKWKSDLCRRRGGGSTSFTLMSWKDCEISSIENGMLSFVEKKLVIVYVFFTCFCYRSIKFGYLESASSKKVLFGVLIESSTVSCFSFAITWNSVNISKKVNMYGVGYLQKVHLFSSFDKESFIRI